MASQLRCTSKSVDLLQAGQQLPISLYRDKYVLGRKQQQLEGCCDDRALCKGWIDICHDNLSQSSEIPELEKGWKRANVTISTLVLVTTLKRVLTSARALILASSGVPQTG